MAAVASTRLTRTLAPGGTPSRQTLCCAPGAAPLVPRSAAAWTEAPRLGAVTGREPGGARRASQEAHTADPRETPPEKLTARPLQPQLATHLSDNKRLDGILFASLQ